MESSDSDEDIKRAIELSLEAPLQAAGSTPNPSKNSSIPTIDLVSDDGRPSSTSEPGQSQISSGSEIITSPALSQGILALNRKAMELERLARKRKASISPPPLRSASKRSNISTSETQPSSVTKATENLSGVGNSRITPSSAPGIQFPHPTIKKTWAFGHNRIDDIKLEEVLQKQDLQLAVLSSFQWDVEWLLHKINTKKSHLVFVMQAKDPATRAQYRRETAYMPNLNTCFPPMEGQVNCMHSKLMLLSHPTHLRVVVPTANLVAYDWGETGVMENSLFLIDLPRMSAERIESRDEMTSFGKDLIYFLKAMTLDESIIQSIFNFDFSATNDIAFVHTIGGAHMGEDEPWRRTGYCGLGRAVEQLGLRIEQPLDIDFITSSLGSIEIDFLTRLYLAAQGDDGTKEYKFRTSNKQKTSKGYQAEREKSAALEKKYKDEIANGFRIYFPTQETVNASKGGPDCGGTICFQQRWWDVPTFPHGLVRDCKSRREGLLMHNKIIYVQPKNASSGKKQGESNHNAWVYVGSANCSESAWGRMVKDRSTRIPKLNCRNWECGVILPVRRSTDSKVEGDGLGVFERAGVPVPMEWPGRGYEGRKPWFYTEHAEK